MNNFLFKATLACAVCLTLIVSFLFSRVSVAATFSELVALGIMGILVSLIGFSLMREDGGVGVDISRPLPLYGVFYLVYYPLPYLLLYFLGQLPDDRTLTLAAMLLVGYLGWRYGVRASLRSRPKLKFDWMPRCEAQALLVVCALGIALVAYFYFLRIDEGIFFNQAQFVVGKLTVFDSVVSVLGQSLQLPIILLLGVLSVAPQPEISRISRRVLLGYAIGIAVIMVLSSQTRPAITAVLFYFIATRFYREGGLKIRQTLLIAALSAAAVVVVQGVRIVSAVEAASAENQLAFSALNAIPNAITALSENQLEMEGRLVSRSAGGIMFLAEIVEAIDARGAPLYGRGIAESAYGLIPRFLWLDKPEVTSPQIVAQQLLHFPVYYDASLGPVTQFYFEAGWLGVVVGFILFGMGLAWLTELTIRGRSVMLWIVLCFVWSHIANIESELVLGIISTVRNALMVFLLWKGLALALGGTHRVIRAKGLWTS